MSAADELVLGAEADAVPKARRFARSRLEETPDLAPDAELVVSELVTNALMHGQTPVIMRLIPGDSHIRIEVRDAGRTPPIMVRGSAQGMTGRGLALVSALAERWGVEPVPGDGKVVWAELTGTADGASPPSNVPQDIEALLAAWSEEEPAEEVHTVNLGRVATDLLVAAKSHIDNVVRELTLVKEGGVSSGAPLPEALSGLIDVVTGEFSAARTELKREASEAAAGGQLTTDVVLHLPLGAAEAGERYLAALDQFDRYARSAQMLTLAPPPEHRIFRRWYVTEVVSQLRARSRGEEPAAVRPFESVLVDEVARLAPLEDVSARLTLLQTLNRRLAAASTPEEMAQIVVDGAMSFPQVETARVRLLGDDGMLRSTAWRGRRSNEAEGLDAFPLEADLPGAAVVRSGRPISLRSLAETFAEHPVLAGTYPPDRSGHIVPLKVAGRSLGAMTLTFARGELADEAETAFVEALADALAQALARAVLAESDERRRETLALLADASQILISAQEPGQVLERIAELAVPRLADWCSVYVADEQPGRLQRAAMTIAGHPGLAEQLKEVPLELALQVPHTRAFKTGKPQPISGDLGQLLEALYPGQDFPAMGQRPHGGSGLCLPIVLRGEVVGIIAIMFLDSGRQVSPYVAAALEGLASRAAIALDHTRRWTAQSQMIQSLVAALLPPGLPHVEGVAFAARYLPAAGDVAGDWWEAEQLSDGSVLVGLGDAAGHGVAAVSEMCEMRFGARVLATFDPSPAALLSDLNRRFAGSDTGLATAVYGRLRPETGELVWASAGHLPPLLLRARGEVETLHPAGGTPLGSPGPSSSVDTTLVLEPGDTLLLYSDGVVERRDEDLGTGISRMVATVASHAGAGLDELADAVVVEHCSQPVDDCCLLLIRRELPART